MSSAWRQPIRRALVRNRPFVDGNKRTGFVVGILFLELNGYRFTQASKARLGLFWSLRPERSMSPVTPHCSAPTLRRHDVHVGSNEAAGGSAERPYIERRAAHSRSSLAWLRERPAVGRR